ncbi:MAG: nuclear transport factor 2 family protein [Flavobacteriales bacterium]|nr:nuclear transport factor 2 family protein [Flavobacteriales bacterium]
MKQLVLVSFFIFLTWSTFAQKYSGDQSDIDAIIRQSDAWSEYYVEGDVRKLAELYSIDGKIMPNNSEIISGRDAIAEKFQPKEGIIALQHKVSPEEITVLGHMAYDYGYYEGVTRDERNIESPFKGKYVIIWKKIEGEWYIYLDIWNRIVIPD